MFNVQLQLTPSSMVTCLSRHSMILDTWKAEACTRYKAKLTPVLEIALQLFLVFDFEFFLIMLFVLLVIFPKLVPHL